MKFVTGIFTGLTVFLLTISAVRADPLDDAKAAYYREDFQTALGLLLPLAKQGNAEAQEKIGEIYLYGWGGVPQDCSQAGTWLLRAADQRYVYAAHQLGRLFDDGKCADRNTVLAYMWYTIAQTEMPKPVPSPFLNRDTASAYDIAGIARPAPTADWRLINRVAADRTVIAEGMTLDQIDEAARLAKNWKPGAGQAPAP